jgi:hypothetical protein
MARTKQRATFGHVNGNPNGTMTQKLEKEVEKVAGAAARDPKEMDGKQGGGLLALGICVGGIYASLWVLFSFLDSRLRGIHNMY